MAISQSMIKRSINKARVEVAAYFRTLAHLEDFISLRPDAVLGYYTESDAFIKCCEGDVLKLRDTRRECGCEKERASRSIPPMAFFRTEII